MLAGRSVVKFFLHLAQFFFISIAVVVKSVVYYRENLFFVKYLLKRALNLLNNIELVVIFGKRQLILYTECFI